MKPRVLNRICAHAEIVACILGSCAFNALLYGFGREVPLRDIAPDWQYMLYLLVLAVPAATLLGALLGMFAFWPSVRVVCSRINGAPLKPGDQVLILSGAHKGTTAKVHEITLGQAGWELARLDLGEEYKGRCADIYEEYSLLRLQRGEQSVSANGSKEC